ncbi:syntaxin-16-like [Clavelina lepadiformis]|uniref:t-SNARE coiled-coil homology domain-containing protein n=1 Tax=Clavelina lepadiformis TaxID=159417 RepID=A0ABP0G7P0_CLALP
MAVRSLMEAFVLMRNNAIQNKNFLGRNVDYYEEDDTVALVSKRKQDTTISFRKTFSIEWNNRFQDIQYDIDRIKEKVDELSTLHDRHLTRPTLDDTLDEEHGIEIFTQEITQIFHKCNNSIKSIGRSSEKATFQEREILKNAISSFANHLQQLSTDFRIRQSTYLKKLKAREERSHQYFSSNTALMIEQDDISDEMFERGFTQDQVAIINQNSVNIDQREEEIRSVVQSITDLAEIFQDLGQIVIEQGTVLDRIDYNVEHAVIKTETGLEELKKAENYQKKNRKMLIIFTMSVILIVLLIILIVSKS